LAKDESLIGSLSLRELKVVLDENFVSYEGFLEKSEFEGAVKRLAQNYALEKKEGWLMIKFFSFFFFF